MASILVVDDEPSIRRLLRITLEREHVVGEAADGWAAFNLLLEQPWDVAVLDVAMPIMDGLALCRAVRAEESLAHLGIIIVSAYVSPEEAHAVGADRHLQKPFRPFELLAVVEEVLSLRHGREK